MTRLGTWRPITTGFSERRHEFLLGPGFNDDGSPREEQWRRCAGPRRCRECIKRDRREADARKATRDARRAAREARTGE